MSERRLTHAAAGLSGARRYVELAVIDAICQWCVASATGMTALASVCVGRLLTGGAVSESIVRQITDERAAGERQTRTDVA